MTSHSFFDRIASPRIRSPIQMLHSPPRRQSSEYQLNQLDPRPDHASPSSVEDDLPTAWLTEQDGIGTPRESSPSSWRDKASSAGSVSSKSKMKPRAMFAGPPPPITASMMIGKNKNKRSSVRSPGRRNGGTQTLVAGLPPGIASVLFDQRPETSPNAPDSHWRGLRRREKALEQEVQKLLDLQAAALIAGIDGASGVPGDELDGFSDGSSTPTGTFYSTKSSKSRMTNSLYVPTRETPDGNVIPVRQPAKDQPKGLRATRTALLKLITAMAKLKLDETDYLDSALAQRTDALAYLEGLGTRRENIHAELHSLEEEGDEPLGQELKELHVKHDTLDEEIHRLEAKLVTMRNRRRWLREKMEDVKNRREAGLSGYRGALQSVESEVNSLVRQPPIQPLDPDITASYKAADGDPSPGGVEFMKLIPERRTLDMAKTWWEGEVVALEERKIRIEADHKALEDGGTMWEAVIQLVTDFESSLRQLTKGNDPVSASPSRKGKERVPTREETISSQLLRMKQVVEELEQYMAQAESNHWNLLICAIGAELEAFKEAYEMLSGLVEDPSSIPTKNGDSHDLLQQDAAEASHSEPSQGQSSVVDESDNEVPPDLLGAPSQDTEDDSEPASQAAAAGDGAPLRRCESENEVPPEFLAEHVHDD